MKTLTGRGFESRIKRQLSLPLPPLTPNPPPTPFSLLPGSGFCVSSPSDKMKTEIPQRPNPLSGNVIQRWEKKLQTLWEQIRLLTSLSDSVLCLRPEQVATWGMVRHPLNDHVVLMFCPFFSHSSLL